MNKPILVVIGSKALNLRVPNTRVEKDLDVVCSNEAFKLYISLQSKPSAIYPIAKGNTMLAKWENGNILEAEITWEGSNQEELYNLVLSDKNTFIQESDDFIFMYPSLDVLYMIKMSHRFLRNSPSFRKTMKDIKLLRRHGAKFNPNFQQWFIRRETDTYWYKHPDLSVDKKGFFKPEEVRYLYDHDTIHEAVKILDKPAYTFYMKDGEQVMCDRDKFDALPHETKLLGVLEESYVLALERHQIPNDFKPDPKHSFLIALSKVCTSITSGWFREFSYENYDEVLSLYNENYVEKFKTALSAGRVKGFYEETV